MYSVYSCMYLFLEVYDCSSNPSSYCKITLLLSHNVRNILLITIQNYELVHFTRNEIVLYGYDLVKYGCIFLV